MVKEWSDEEKAHRLKRVQALSSIPNGMDKKYNSGIRRKQGTVNCTVSNKMGTKSSVQVGNGYY